MVAIVLLSCIELHLTINSSVTDEVSVTACDSYTWTDDNGETYEASGDYVWETTTPEGCDKIVTLHLTVNPLLTYIDDTIICANQFPYTFHGHVFNAAGIQTGTLPSTVTGCDSTWTLTVEESPLLTASHTVSVCANDFPYTWLPYGHTFTEPGSWTDTVPNPQGCDTIVTLTVVESPLLTASHTVSVCANDFPYTWQPYGHTFIEPGSWTDTVPNPQGCDTIVTLTVVESPLLTASHSVSICANDFPYTWQPYGHTFIEPGSWTDTIPNPQGCDTVVTLTVDVFPVLYGDTTAVACDSFMWYDGIHTEAGSHDYEWTLTSTQGCDSIVTLHLTIRYGTHDVFSADECESYTWNGTTYNTSGTYTYDT